MNTTATTSRRRFLRESFCFSAALGLGRLSSTASAQDSSPDDLHYIAVGDFGSNDEKQAAVASGMKRYVDEQARKPDALLLLGDNFYSKMTGGVKSERWKTGFEDMYPASHFPGPAYAILGNHDYHDNAGGELTQLAYAAATPGTRWYMPKKWYRVDLKDQSGTPVLTLLCVDTDIPGVADYKDKKTGEKKVSMSQAESDEQLAWLKAELAKPRGTFTIVCGHHPLFTNGRHGDNKNVTAYLDPLLREHKVHMYLCGHDHDLQHLEFENHPTSFVISGGGGARAYEVKDNGRGPFAQMVYGFSHLQVNSKRLILRHLDANRKLLHTFSKTPDGKVTVL